MVGHPDRIPRRRAATADGGYPETGFGEVTRDVLEADFWPASLTMLQLPDCPLTSHDSIRTHQIEIA